MSKMLTKSKAFTLIEVLVVIVLLGVLTASQAPKVANQFDKPKDLAVTRDFQKYIDTAKLTHAQGKDITNYKHLNQELVPELQIDSNEMSKTNNPYGNPYTYSILPSPDKGFKIISTGGKVGTRSIKVNIDDNNKLIVTWAPEVNGTGLGTGGNNTTPPTPVDKSQLEQVIQQAEQDLDKYTPSSKDIIEPLIEEAKNTNNNPNATQSEVDDITGRLNDALDKGVKYNVDNFYTYTPETINGVEGYKVALSDGFWTYLDSNSTSTDYYGFTNGQPLPNPDSTYNGKPVISMQQMFYESKATTLNLSSFDTSKVTNMVDMFANSKTTTLDLSSFNTSKVTDMSWMFYYSSATTLDLSSFDTSNVIDMEGMFMDSQVTALDLSSFDTSKVTDMRRMFYSAYATTLDLSSFDTSKVTDMSDMFANSSATTLNLSSFDTSKVTDMSDMFFYSQAITLDLSSFDTSNVITMYSMFRESKATTLDLSSFDTSNVANMSQMFESSKATTLNLSSFDTSNVTNMHSMFLGSQATTLDLSSFDISNFTDMQYMFKDSKATTGYARTQEDADRFIHSSTNKPIGLIFIVGKP